MDITRRSLFAMVFAAPLAVAGVTSPKGWVDRWREMGENQFHYYVDQRCDVLIEDFKSVRFMLVGGRFSGKTRR